MLLINPIIDIYIPIILLISMLMTIVVILTYFAAKVFKSTEMEAYLNVELGEIFNSLVITFLAVGLFLAFDSAAVAMFGVPSVSMAAQQTLQSVVVQVQDGITDIFSVQVCLSILSTFHRRIGEFVLTISYKIFPGLDSLVGITNVVGYALVGVFGSLTAQLLLLNFVDSTMVALFLPAGIILRFFPPTREAGVFLISFAIGMQVIFPSIYMINYAVMNDLANNGLAAFHGYESPKGMVSMLCGGKYFVYGALGNPAAPLLGPFFAANEFFSSALRNVFSEFGVNLLSPLEFMSILSDVAFLSLPALFLPALATTITFAFINSMTKFMLTKMG